MKYLFIFAIMSFFGWILEVIYRSICAKNFINPGLMLGVTLPIYGVGGAVLSLLGNIEIMNNIYLNYLILSVISAIILTILELIGGILLLKLFSIKLWDYSKAKFNYKSLICLRMTVVWGLLSFIYFIFLNEFINNLVSNLVINKTFIFILGVFIGIFILDMYFSTKLLLGIKKYSFKQKEIINLELLKLQARGEQANIFALKKIFYLLYPYKNIHEFILLDNEL